MLSIKQIATNLLVPLPRLPDHCFSWRTSGYSSHAPLLYRPFLQGNPVRPNILQEPNIPYYRYQLFSVHWVAMVDPASTRRFTDPRVTRPVTAPAGMGAHSTPMPPSPRRTAHPALAEGLVAKLRASPREMVQSWREEQLFASAPEATLRKPRLPSPREKSVVEIEARREAALQNMNKSHTMEHQV